MQEEEKVTYQIYISSTEGMSKHPIMLAADPIIVLQNIFFTYM